MKEWNNAGRKCLRASDKRNETPSQKRSGKERSKNVKSLHNWETHEKPMDLAHLAKSTYNHLPRWFLFEPKSTYNPPNQMQVTCKVCITYNSSISHVAWL